MTGFSLWLDKTFFAFDLGVLGFYNKIALWGGKVFTPFMEFISAFGKSGIFPLVLSIILMLFKSTRKAGFSGLICFLVAGLFVNIILKPLVMRARPYQTHSQIKEWWTLVNAHTEKDYSFPSGHVSSFASTVIGICFGFKNKKWLFLGVPLALLMCVSRNYLMVHYPTDVLASLITSSIAVAIGVLITNKAFNKIEEKENKFSKFVLTASIVNLFKKKEKTKD